MRCLVTTTTRPEKPYPEFPLFAHSNGKWAKKINGKTCYFGPWNDPDKSLRMYEREYGTHGKLLKPCLDAFQKCKQRAFDNGELSLTTMNDYKRTCKWLLEFFGKRASFDDLTTSRFADYRHHLAKRRSAKSLLNEINRVKCVFNWLFQSQLVATPVCFGAGFTPPTCKVLRRERRVRGKMLFDRDAIVSILEECNIQFQAMALLGINCGFGCTDCATLPLSAVDLDRYCISYPRPKTEVDRLCPLWPETTAALRRVIGRGLHESLVFSQQGLPWNSNTISKRFSRVCKSIGIKGSFYWLRHTFATVASACRDQIAVNTIMGHADHSMSAVYREEIDFSRLASASDHVRKWLYHAT